MAAKKYPIGTKIRFLYNNKDKNKIGTIVGIKYGNPQVYIPNTDYDNVTKNGLIYSWYCAWYHIELAANQQLLFDFMYQNA